ncbi:MAG TPA: MarR family transcriptional regulator [Polyangiales bacterium]
MTSEVTAVLDDLRRIVRVLRESSRAAEHQLGVTGAQLFVMRALSSTRALSLNVLAARTRTHQSTVSVVAKRLVERGFVQRTTSAIDGRRIELELTKRGRKLLQRAPFAAQDRLIEGIEKLPKKARKDLAAALHGLVEAMQLADEAPAMFFDDEEPVAPKKAKHRDGS